MMQLNAERCTRPPPLHSRGVALRFLSLHSPDFNPIELGWSIVKKGIRSKWDALGME